MIRYINNIFRFLPILLIPIILLPIITITIGLTEKPKYQANASIFVEQPLFVDNAIEVVSGGTYDSPAQRHGKFLRELLASRTFVTSVLENSSLKNGLNDKDSRDEAFSIINSIGVDDGQFHSVVLSLTNKNSGLPQELLTIVLEQYFKVLDNRTSNQAQGAIKIYQKEVDNAKIALQEAKLEVTKFIANNPGQIGNVAGANSGAQVLTQVELEYIRLIQLQTAAQTKLDEAQKQQASVQAAYVGYQDNRSNNFRIQDPPQEDALVTAKSRVFLINGIIGLVGGGILATVMLLLITWLDSSFRERATVVRMLALPNINVQDLPAINSKLKKTKGNSFDLRRSLIEQVGWIENQNLTELPKLKAKAK